MKSRLTFLLSTAVSVLTATTLLAQNVVPAVSLGDPIPGSEHDPNIKLVSGGLLSGGSSCNGCSLGFKSGCDTPGCKERIIPVACPNGDCKAPSCAVCAKPAPCKACDLPKLFQRHGSSCATCSTPSPKCENPAPCTACEPKKHVHSVPCTTCAPAAKPAPCSTCAPAPKAVPCATCSTPCPKPAVCAPAPCKAEKVCEPCAKAAPCDACKSDDPCKAHAHVRTSRPILDAIKNLFNSHHAAPAAEGCSSCAATAKATGPITPIAVTTIPTRPTPAPAAQPVSYRPHTEMTTPTAVPAAPVVPAALAPYSSQAPFSTTGANQPNLHDR